MSTSYRNNSRIVLTLDAGGTTFRFFAAQGGRTIVESPPVPTPRDDLAQCLQVIVDGFAAVKARCPAAPVAISFAFPGPADYPRGIIGDLPNLPAFRGGVPLGPLLEERFQLPVFINNDGALFAYGEAIAGFLPFVNDLLAQSGSFRRYHNLLGVTLGTGFGGGIVLDGRLLVGDNSSGGHVFRLRNRLDPEAHVEETVSIRAVRRVYAGLAGIEASEAPEPKVLARIARGLEPGQRAAAVETFRQFGQAAGDAIAQALTLVDGLVVIGGGLANAADLFLPALVEAMYDVYPHAADRLRRLGPQPFNLEDAEERRVFCQGNWTTLPVPDSTRKVSFDNLPRTGVGVTRLGTSAAIALGAYAFALHQLGGRQAG